MALEAIPTEKGLIKQYGVVLESGDDSVKSVYFTDDGTDQTNDLSPELQCQGVAIFIKNSSNSPLTVEIFDVITLYDNDYEVKIGEFIVPASSNQGFATGYGLISQQLRVDITPSAAPNADTTIAVDIVPCNG